MVARESTFASASCDLILCFLSWVLNFSNLGYSTSWCHNSCPNRRCLGEAVDPKFRNSPAPALNLPWDCGIRCERGSIWSIRGRVEVADAVDSSSFVIAFHLSNFKTQRLNLLTDLHLLHLLHFTVFCWIQNSYDELVSDPGLLSTCLVCRWRVATTGRSPQRAREARPGLCCCCCCAAVLFPHWARWFGEVLQVPRSAGRASGHGRTSMKL